MATIAANPYASQLGESDPVAVLAETPTVLRRLTNGWREQDFERTYAPGKWTARQILLHLVQVDLMFSVRARVAVSGDAREVQTFDQDRWLARETAGATGAEALAAFLALRRINVPLFRSLTPEELAIELRHPERGAINVDWIVRTLAGHDRNHLEQLETIAAAAGRDRLESPLTATQDTGPAGDADGDTG